MDPSQSHQPLKEGYLLAQDLNKKWKMRWFVLTEDQLLCCHKKNKSVVISTILLTGCSVACPAPDETELGSQAVLKLHLPEGEELLFLAGGKEDRDRMGHAVGAVIRCVSTSQEIIHRQMSFKDFHSHANVCDIIGALQDPDAGIECNNHLRGGTVFKNCFTGSNIVDWLLRWSLVRNRSNGASMGQALLKLGHLQEVDLRDGTSGFSPKFSDDEKLYRFTSINLGAKRNSFYDSGDSDSSSSDEDDDDDCDTVEQNTKKGKVLKEGFLPKKRSLRKGWKIMKVVVKESPPRLQYFRAKYAAVADEKFSCKVIQLSKCKVVEIIKPAHSNKGNSTNNSNTRPVETSISIDPQPRFRLAIRKHKGRALKFHMKDEQEKVEWLSVLSELCGQGSQSLGPRPQQSTNGAQGGTW